MIEILAALAALGLWFWALAGVIILAAIVSVENEKFTVTTPIVVIGIAALIWLSGASNVLGWARENIATIIAGVAIYLVVGVIYGVIRYMFYVHKIADRLTDWAKDYGYNVSALTKSQAASFAARERLANFPLKVSDSKSRIIFWGIYWPFSMPWTLINEPVKRFFNFAYGRMAGFMQIVADRAFRSVKIVDDPTPEPKGLTGTRQQLNG
jgi:hypothetical protein